MPPLHHSQAGGACPVLRTRVDDDAVLGQLLLDEDDLLGAPDDEVAPRVQRALTHTCQLLFVLASQHAPAGTEAAAG